MSRQRCRTGVCGAGRHELKEIQSYDPSSESGVKLRPETCNKATLSIKHLEMHPKCSWCVKEQIQANEGIVNISNN